MGVQQVPELGAGLVRSRVVDGVVGKGVFHQEFQSGAVRFGVEAGQGLRKGIVGDGGRLVPVIPAQQIDVRQQVGRRFRLVRAEHFGSCLPALGGEGSQKAEDDEGTVHVVR